VERRYPFPDSHQSIEIRICVISGHNFAGHSREGGRKKRRSEGKEEDKMILDIGMEKNN
jgi:hypothetical protein